MKKFLAVFMALLMVFTSTALVVFAADPADPTTTVAEDEKTTRNIKNDDGLVVPINFKQLKFSVIFKLIEKVIKWILNLFGGDSADDIDQSIADDISSIGEDVSKAIEEGSQFIEDNINP